MADHIAILAPPGKVVASGSPVTLKRDFGQGYSVHVSITDASKAEYPSDEKDDIMQAIQEIVPQAYASNISPRLVCYHLKTRDADTVTRVLELLDCVKGLGKISSYDLMGTTIEDVFLNVMNENQITGKASFDSSSAGTLAEPLEKFSAASMDLPSGRPVSSIRQAVTIFHKRCLIARRSWLTPLLSVLVAVAGSCIPLLMINGREQLCTPPLGDIVPPTPLYLPFSPLLMKVANVSPAESIYASPPGIVSTLGRSTDVLQVTYLSDNATFVDTFTNSRNMSIGGVSINQSTGESLIAWEATQPGYKGLTTLNLASNILLNRALNSSGNAAPVPTLIQGQYIMFNKLTAATLVYLKWMFFFGAVMVRLFCCGSDLCHVSDLYIAGSVSCVCGSVRRQRTVFIGSSDAILKWPDKSCWPVVRPPNVRHYILYTPFNYYRYCLCCRFRSVPWTWIYGKCY